MRTSGATCMPMVAATPLTLTQPLPIQSSASRREASPSSAMRLFSLSVPLGPMAAVLVCPAGIGGRLAGGAARRKTGAAEAVADGSDSVICYKFRS